MLQLTRISTLAIDGIYVAQKTTINRSVNSVGSILVAWKATVNENDS